MLHLARWLFAVCLVLTVVAVILRLPPEMVDLINTVLAGCTVVGSSFWLARKVFT